MKTRFDMKNQEEKMAMTARTYMTIGSLVVLLLWVIVGASQDASTRGLTGDFLGRVASPFIGLVWAGCSLAATSRHIKLENLSGKEFQKNLWHSPLASNLQALKPLLHKLCREFKTI
jgi:hypothetical protein